MTTTRHANTSECGRRLCAAHVALAALCALAVAGCGGVDARDYKQYSSETESSANTDDDRSRNVDNDAETAKDTPAAEDPLDPKPVRPDVIKPKQTEQDKFAKAEIVADPKTTSPRLNAFDDDIESVQARKPSPQPADQNGSPALVKLEPRVPRVLVTERRFNVEGPEDSIRVTYDDIDLLRVLNMEPVIPDALKLFPDWLKSLDGKRIRLRGFMYPAFSETGLTGFGFARDNDICCFGKNPKVYDLFAVKLRENVTTDYIQGRPFDVVGVFHILPASEEWNIFGMYRMDDAIVVDP